MSILTATTLICTHGAIWNYPGYWQDMYPHINRSTWPKSWPNVKWILCSFTLGHHMTLPGSMGGFLMTGNPDPPVDYMASWCEMPPMGTLKDVGGYIWKLKTVYCKVLLITADNLLQTIAHWLRSMRPKLVPVLATRCLCQGVGISELRSTGPNPS